MKLQVDIDSLEKSFSYITAIDQLSLKIEKGDFVTLLGPNGAGKSTLLKIISTLLKPTGGKVRIAGFDLLKQRTSIRRITGFISHETMIYENLTASENLEFISVFYGIENRIEKCEKLLEKVGLYKRKDDYVKNFSSGMKQRLSIARALINDPEILLLDEPYNGLDQDGIKSLSEILHSLKSKGRTIILTTHNFDEGLDLSDRLLILNNGKLVFDKVNSDIKQDLKEVYFSTLAN